MNTVVKILSGPDESKLGLMQSLSGGVVYIIIDNKIKPFRLESIEVVCITDNIKSATDIIKKELKIV